MKTINFYLQGFGFENIKEYLVSTFGFMTSAKVIATSSVIGVISAFLQDYLGFNLLVFSAFVFLNILEYNTGIRASKKRGERIESRKMGRMFLKVGTYLAIIWMLHSFRQGLDFPQIMELELNPFIVFYWAFLSGVIYQIFKSLLENLEQLDYKEARGVLGFIRRKYSRFFESNNDSNSAT